MSAARPARFVALALLGALGACGVSTPEPAPGVGVGGPGGSAVSPRDAGEPPAASAASATSAAVGPSPAGPGAAPAGSAGPTPPAALPPELAGGGPRSVSGRDGVVTTVEERATRAGVLMLERRGTAADAAVAAAAVLAVTHPSAGNLGGGGFALLRRRGGPTVALDFREAAPAALTAERYQEVIDAEGFGPKSVGVPGSVAGLVELHRRAGRLPLAEVLAPAIALAREHALGPREALTLGWAWRHLKRDRHLARVYGQGGKARGRGARVRQPELAAVLERVAREGAAGFYRGPTAEALVKALRVRGGWLTLADLERYQVRERAVLTVPYRGYTVELMPPSSGGGVAVALSLLALERLEAWRHPAGSLEDAHLFLEVARRAQAERRFGVGDPDRLSADEYRARRARWATADTLLRVPIDPAHATPSASVHALHGVALEEQQHTTHLSVVDAEGTVVSLTTTLSGGFGARLAAAGMVMNNSVAAFATAGENGPAPGARTVSSMAPALLLRGDAVVAVLGSPGGNTIPSTVTQVLRHLVDHRMTLDDAVDAPRWHHGFVPDEARYEREGFGVHAGRGGAPRALLEGLERLGHRFSKQRRAMGDANDLVMVGDVAFGYADPREGGLALAASRGEAGPSPQPR